MRIFALLVVVFVYSLTAFAQKAPEISGFQANLFNSKTGTFSTDVLAAGAPELGNIPAGEFSSVAVFIAVKVDLGPNASVPKNLSVRLIASESTSQPFAANKGKTDIRVILNSTSRIGPVDKDGKTFVGFWLTGTGCRSVTLKAALIGAQNAATKTEVLPFACYE